MSWVHVVSTLLTLALALVAAATAPWWPLRWLASVLGGLLMVRTFILYHDHMHNALLRDSRFARVLFEVIGLLLLAPPSYWRHSHNFHHGNVGKPLPSEDGPSLLLTSDLGSFPLMTTTSWRTASFAERFRYRSTRHPITLLFAGVTVFLFGLSVLPLLRSPRKFWDGALAIAAHATLLAALWVWGGTATMMLSLVVPYAIASALGAYLFFAQHNFAGMRVLRPEDWTYYLGATKSSSFMRLGPVMRWFTGNIGYHHVHHLNPLIPFYRLPEALAAVPELQNVRTTTLRPRDVLASFRLNLWDPERLELVAYRQARVAT